MTLKNALGYVLAVVMITGLVWLGLVFIKTDGQLAVVLVGVMAAILTMGLVTIYLRYQRDTKRELYRKPNRNFYEHIPTGEQKPLQLSVILLVAMIILGVILKGPKVLKVILEVMNRSNS
jgi:hypothetical protein